MLLETLEEAVVSFRCGREGAANFAVAAFTDELGTALQNAQDPRVVHSLLPWLREVMTAQEKGDHLRVADILEYEIAPLL